MIEISKLLPRGAGLAAVLLKRAPSVELDWDTRQKSRFECTDSQGRALGVFLERGRVVRGGDVLVGTDGSLVRVVAKPQPVLRVTHCAAHGSAFDLMRAAYHLGNRHVSIELHTQYLQIEPDHVLADLLRAMHLTVSSLDAPFEPESGAYASQHEAAHSHAHEHDHGQGHSHAHPAEHEHVHGEHCNHHGHGHEHG